MLRPDQEARFIAAALRAAPPGSYQRDRSRRYAARTLAEVDAELASARRFIDDPVFAETRRQRFERLQEARSDLYAALGGSL